MPFPLIPIIAALVAGGSAAVAARNAKKQRELAKSESELAYQRDVEMWEKQNAYNAPAAQMERLKASGLNPNLVYGSGAVGNQSGSTPSYQPSRETSFAPMAIPAALESYQEFQMRAAQIDNVRAQTENTHQKTMTEAITRYVKELQGKTGEFDLDRRKYLAPYQAAITGNEARASEAKLMQEWQRLTNMQQSGQMQLLEQEYKRKAMTAVDLDNEKREADIIYKKYQNQWMKMGITSSDNLILRILVRMINDSGFQGDISTMFPK